MLITLPHVQLSEALLSSDPEKVSFEGNNGNNLI